MTVLVQTHSGIYIVDYVHPSELTFVAGVWLLYVPLAC